MVTNTIIKKGYKQTEIGVIPEDWKVKKLREVGETYGGLSGKKKSDFNGGKYPYIPFMNIMSNPVIDLQYFDYVTIRGNEKQNKAINGDLFFNGSSETPEEVGMCSVLQGDIPNLYLNSFCFGFRLNKDLKTDGLYLSYFFRSPMGRQLIFSLAQGATRYNLSKTNFMKLEIPYPDPVEQSAIATVLSDTDVLVEHLKRLIAKKKAIKQGALQQLLTGKKRLPGFSGEWDVKKLGEIGEITGAGIDKKLKSDEVPVRLVNYLDVFHKNFIYSKDLNYWVTAPIKQSQRCAVKKGDIFFTPSSEMRYDIGISAVAMEDIPDAGYSYHVDRLRLFDNWDLAFRAYIFKTKNFLDQAETICEGSGKRYVISMTKFREMTVRYPVDKSEQTAIATILSDMDADIKSLEQKRDKYTMLKQGMMQQLLTGRIRIYANN